MQYDIEPELKIKRILEPCLDFHFSLTKNEDKYAYDLKIDKTITSPNGDYKSSDSGFIEIEHSQNWNLYEIPKYWKENPTYLFRKLFIFNWDEEKWTTELKQNASETIYLIFNLPFTNCHCQSIEYIVSKGIPSNRNGKSPDKYRLYNDFYMVLKDRNEYVFGIENCGIFINKFFNNLCNNPRIYRKVKK